MNSKKGFIYTNVCRKADAACFGAGILALLAAVFAASPCPAAAPEPWMAILVFITQEPPETYGKLLFHNTVHLFQFLLPSDSNLLQLVK